MAEGDYDTLWLRFGLVEHLFFVNQIIGPVKQYEISWKTVTRYFEEKGVA